MADLTIFVDVHELDNGEIQTLSRYKIPKSGKLVFENTAQPGEGDLQIKAKLPTTELPFCEDNGKKPKTLDPIKPGKSDEVRICDMFPEKSEFFYTAQIGTALPEDPIVIIERKQNVPMESLAALFLGVGIGAAAAYLIVKSRANKMRPQQG